MVDTDKCHRLATPLLSFLWTWLERIIGTIRYDIIRMLGEDSSVVVTAASATAAAVAAAVVVAASVC